MKHIVTLFFVLFVNNLAVAEGLPCFVTQIDPLIEGSSTTITGVVTGNSDYPNPCITYQKENRRVQIKFTVGVLDYGTTDNYRVVTEGIVPFGPLNSWTIYQYGVALDSLPAGQYLLETFDGEQPLERFPFSVYTKFNGYNRDGSHLALPYILPFGQPSSRIENGVLIFRGHLGGAANLSGYLYQTYSGSRAIIIPAEFRQWTQEDSAEPGLVRAEMVDQVIGGIHFDPDVRIRACVVKDGLTRCFVVFDPNVGPVNVPAFKANAWPFVVAPASPGQ